MTQHGFFFDQSRCTGCQTCSVACKNHHGLPPGPLKYLRIYQYEKGAFPDVRLHTQWVPCYHCQKPICADACPLEAIYKEPDFGAVLIDSDKCDGCRLCYDACPYGAPAFEKDVIGETAQKCNLCVDEIEAGRKPYCVMACMMLVLDVGPIDQLRANTYDTKAIGPNETPVRQVKNLANVELTNPSIVFVPHSKGRVD